MEGAADDFGDTWRPDANGAAPTMTEAEFDELFGGDLNGERVSPPSRRRTPKAPLSSPHA